MTPSAHSAQKPRLALLLISGLSSLSSAFAQTAPATDIPAPAGDHADATPGNVVRLNPFAVTTDADYGYRKMSQVTTSRVGISLLDAPQAIEVIPGELYQDLGLTSERQIFQYSSSVTANQQEVAQAGSFTLRGFEIPQYINGIAMANTGTIYGFLPADNIERVEVAKGPVGLFYANSAPNGVANIITKRPEFIDRTTLELDYGSFGYKKAVIDTQYVVDKRLGIAFRIIGAAEQRHERVQFEPDNYRFVDPSITIRPSDKLEIHAELAANSFDKGYAANGTWNLAVNPLYYQDITHPSAQMISYIEKTYGATTPAAATTIINQRWGTAAPTGLGWLTSNWVNDHFGATGVAAFPFVGNSVNWNTYSPYGKNFLGVTPDSDLNGQTYTADASIVLTPFPGTSIQYHWLRMTLDQHFDRGVLLINAGPLVNGQQNTMSDTAQTQIRNDINDTQQLDLAQEVDVIGIKNKLSAGLEWDRNIQYTGSAPTNAALAPTVAVPGGGTETGAATLANFYPFGGQPFPQIFPLVSGAYTVAENNPVKYYDWYASYRASLFNDSLNLLAGVRDVKQDTALLTSTGENRTTTTFGAIYKIIPGLYLFGDISETFQFSSGYNLLNVQGNPIAGQSTPLGDVNGKGREIGFKTAFFNDKLTGTISYFWDRENGIVEPDVAANNADPRNNDGNANDQVRWSVNGGLQQVQGIDMDTIWTPTEQFQVLFNATWMSQAATLSDPSVNLTNLGISAANELLYLKDFDRRLQKAPKFASNLVAKYNFRTGILKDAFVGAALRYKDTWYLSSAVNYDLYVPTQFMVDAFAGYRTRIYGIPTTIQLNLNDLNNNYDDFTRGDGFVASAKFVLTF